jgi:glutamate synthase (NADH)
MVYGSDFWSFWYAGSTKQKKSSSQPTQVFNAEKPWGFIKFKREGISYIDENECVKEWEEATNELVFVPLLNT